MPPPHRMFQMSRTAFVVTPCSLASFAEDESRSLLDLVARLVKMRIAASGDKTDVLLSSLPSSGANCRAISAS